ncbi:hypothetical protein [Herbiconiux sp. UC225_62]|uniref:hypothetical protein n=1 Tax=Herbiconiux sp. UC225_62 TaxID=3350168 RepID=UPI0036D24BB6
MLAGIQGAPLYVTPADCLASNVHREIGRLAPNDIAILGGTATLSPNVEALRPCGA